LLITNKHVLPPEHGPKEMSVRIAVRSEIGEVEVKDVILPILGTDGKYLRSVAFHPNPGVDVAAIDCGADLSRQHANLFREISETHRALTTDLLISDRDFEEAALGWEPRFMYLDIRAGCTTLATHRRSSGLELFQRSRTRISPSIRSYEPSMDYRQPFLVS